MISKLTSAIDLFEKATQTKPRLFAFSFILGVIFSYYLFKNDKSLDNIRLTELKEENKHLKTHNSQLLLDITSAYNRGRFECQEDMEKTYNFLKKIAEE